MSVPRSVKPIAVGTWSARKLKAPTAAAGQFQPVDTSQPGSAFGDAVEATRKNNEDWRSGQSPAIVIAKQVARLAMGAKHERERQKPHWSVRQAGESAASFLNEVARFCLGRRSWDLAAMGPLLDAAPELAEPLRTLSAAAKDLPTREKLATRAEASALTDPVLAAAEHAAKIVKERYRALPYPVSMPWIGARVTGAQRARALDAAITEYDHLLTRWYAFVFDSPLPSGREAQLAHLTGALSVAAEVTACEQQRGRCRTMANAGVVTRPAARQVVKDLRDAVSVFEDAAFRAVTGVTS